MSAENAVYTPNFMVVPILPSLNFNQTREFYVTNLGFDEVAAACDDYLIIRRGPLEMHFWLSDDPLQCQSSSVFFRSDVLPEIYAELCARGVETVTPSDTRGQRVLFHVRDPHGNLLMFGGVQQ